MRTMKKLLTPVVAIVFLCLLSCQQEEALTTKTNDTLTDFIPGQLATVSIAKDYQITFYEPAAGAIVVTQYASIEANEKASPAIREILRNSSYVEMYSQLAGLQQDDASLEKIKAAELRYNNRMKKGTFTMLGSTKSALEESAGNEGARTLASCSGGDYSGNWFYNLKLKTPPAGGMVLVQGLNYPSFTTPVSTGPSLRFEIPVMNGQLLNSGNDVWVSLPGVPESLVHPRWLITHYMGPNMGGHFSFSFLNGLKCKSTHFGIIAFNN